MIYIGVIISFFFFNSFQIGLAKKNRVPKDNVAVLYFAALVLIIISACRYQDYHSDFLTNYKHMIRMNTVLWPDVLKEENVGHAIFRKIIISIFKDPQWYFFFSSVLILAAFVKTAKTYSYDYFLMVLLFYTIGFYFTGNNVTRQAIAVAISLFAWKYIFERKLIKYLSIMIIAISFHSSAIFFVPMYYISKIKVNKNILYFYTAFGGFIIIFQKQVVSFFQKYFYSDYTGQAYGTTGSNPIRLLLVAMIVFYLVVMANNTQATNERIKEKIDENSELFHNFLFHSTLIYIIMAVLSALNSLMFSRLSMYWDIPMLISLEYSVNICKKEEKSGYRILLIIGCLAWFLTMDYFGKLCPTPYTPFWWFTSRPNI